MFVIGITVSSKRHTHSREQLAHGIGVAAAGIIALLDPASTIAVPLPEGNGGAVIGCGFKRDLAHAGFGQAPLGFVESSRTGPQAPISPEDVDGDDVTPDFTMRGKNEPDGFAVHFRDDAI